MFKLDGKMTGHIKISISRAPVRAKKKYHRKWSTSMYCVMSKLSKKDLKLQIKVNLKLVGAQQNHI